jgi:hypothetical protein
MVKDSAGQKLAYVYFVLACSALVAGFENADTDRAGSPHNSV